MHRTFDTAIGSAVTPRPISRHRSRIWPIATAAALLLVAGHVIAADPLGRARADIQKGAERRQALAMPTVTGAERMESVMCARIIEVEE